MAKRKSTKGQTTIYKTYTQVHWSDESRFFLHVTDGRVRVWRQPNTAYAERNIVETLSYDCKLDLITVRGNLKWTNLSAKHPWSKYCASLWQSSSEYKACLYGWQGQTHRARVVTDYLRDESITTLPWPTRSPDLNPIEHIWNIIGRRVRERTPPAQTLNELEQTLHREWQRLTLVQIRRLMGSHPCEWKLPQLLTFFAWYEISKPNDSVRVQIVFKWWNSR